MLVEASEPLSELLTNHTIFQVSSPASLVQEHLFQILGTDSSKALDSSLKRHTALIKRIRQSVGADNHDQLLKDIDSLSLEKYVDEIAGAVIEGITRCKTEKDVWSAVEVHLIKYIKGL
jgi:hypothetical protein